MSGRPKNIGRQETFSEILERAALEQFITVATTRGPAGRKVLEETLRSVYDPEDRREHAGPGGK